MNKRHPDEHEPQMWPTASDVPWQVLAQATLDWESEEARQREARTERWDGMQWSRRYLDAWVAQREGEADWTMNWIKPSEEAPPLSNKQLSDYLHRLNAEKAPPKFTLWPGPTRDPRDYGLISIDPPTQADLDAIKRGVRMHVEWENKVKPICFGFDMARPGSDETAHYTICHQPRRAGKSTAARLARDMAIAKRHDDMIAAEAKPTKLELMPRNLQGHRPYLKGDWTLKADKSPDLYRKGDEVVPATLGDRVRAFGTFVLFVLTDDWGKRRRRLPGTT